MQFGGVAQKPLSSLLAGARDGYARLAKVAEIAADPRAKRISELT
jgi:hypothetical protein